MDALTHEPAELATRRRARTWPMVLLCLLVIGGIVFGIWFWPKTATNTDADKDAKRPIPVLIAPAARKDVPIYMDGLGTVQAFNTVTVKPQVDGTLVSVAFKEGQMVRKGDLLAQIDPRTYQAALDNAEAKRAQDEALLANARLDLARYRKLIASNYTSAQQADTAASLVAQLEAQVRQDQAQIDTARTNLQFTTITSPLDGRVGMRVVDAGNVVHASDPGGLLVITQLQPVSVLFTLPQQALPAVVRAMAEGTPAVTARSQAGPGTAGTPLDTGFLAVLDNQVDATTGTIRMKATFPNTKSQLWPGGFVGVRLQIGTAKDAVVIPPAAIQRGPRGTYVYMMAEDGESVRRQPTVIGYEDERGAVVQEGLTGGETVVVDGTSRLSEGSKVVVTRPAAVPGAGAPPAGPEPARAPGARRRSGGEG